MCSVPYVGRPTTTPAALPAPTTIESLADILQEHCGACCLDDRDEAEKVAKEVVKYLVMNHIDMRWLRTLYLLGVCEP